jgi:hypothetical protein
VPASTIAKGYGPAAKTDTRNPLFERRPDKERLFVDQTRKIKSEKYHNLRL